MSGRKAMSLEAALEEERLEIENIILQRQYASRSPPPLPASGRSSSPYTSPQSPVRSMLDVGPTPRSPPPVPVRSMLDISSGPPRSMLEISAAPLASGARSPGPTSTHTSPTLSYKAPIGANSSRNRSMSDAASTPAEFGPRSPPPMSPPLSGRNNDIMSSYQFGNILPTIGQAGPGRRVQQPGPRSGSIGEALRSPDLSNLVLPGERGRGFPRRTNKSKSPSNRFSLRSNSPHGSLLGNSSGAHQQSQGTLMLDNGQIVDMNNAYRKLSDANLIYGGSGLASLARKKAADSDGLGRIEKDNMSPYGELLSDEDSDDDANSSDEESQRGRKLTTRADEQRGSSAPASSAKSLLAAAEEERTYLLAKVIQRLCSAANNTIQENTFLVNRSTGLSLMNLKSPSRARQVIKTSQANLVNRRSNPTPTSTRIPLFRAPRRLSIQT